MKIEIEIKIRNVWRHLWTSPYLSVEIAVLVVSVVAVELNVDTLAEPGQAHDDEQLQEEDQLQSNQYLCNCWII
jgi:hypothetical protein